MRRFNFSQDGQLGVQGYGNGTFYRHWMPSHADNGVNMATGPRPGEHLRGSSQKGATGKSGGGFAMDKDFVNLQADKKAGWKVMDDRKHAREEALFQAALERDQRNHEASLARQDENRRVKMLQSLMGGGRSGFDEQIFNNAGSPQVVKLQKDNSAQMAQIIAQMLGR